MDQDRCFNAPVITTDIIYEPTLADDYAAKQLPKSEAVAKAIASVDKYISLCERATGETMDQRIEEYLRMAAVNIPIRAFVIGQSYYEKSKLPALHYGTSGH